MSFGANKRFLTSIVGRGILDIRANYGEMSELV